MKTKEEEKERFQYYHRHVTALLLAGGVSFLLDVEPQRPGEDEVEAALRLLARVLRCYPRAFDIVLEVIAVLKDNRREVMRDARGIFKQEAPVIYASGALRRECWDVEGLTSWEALGRPIRVVRSVETLTVRRQSAKRAEEVSSEWWWVTTFSQNLLPTLPLVEFAHRRWAIENNGFHELTHEWHADHLYKHDPAAMEAVWLLTMLAYNLFHAFIRLNLKPARTAGTTNRYWAEVITASFYGFQPRGPT